MHKNIMNEELNQFRETYRKWLKAEVVPHQEKWREAGIIPKEMYRKAGAQGFLCLTQGVEYGGLGLDFRYSAVAIEEMARIGESGLAYFLHSDIIAPYIEEFGNEVQKKKYLPKMADGSMIGAIAMTEPGAGSDLQAIQTSARLEGDTWVINGQKTFISNGQCSDLVIVVAKTGDSSDPKRKYARQSLFIVEAATPGFTRGRTLKKIGCHSQDTAELFFQECRVPKENLLGVEGEAFKYLMKQLGRERLTIAIWSLALAQKSLEETIAYCKSRKLFSQAVSDFQNARFKFAEMATEISFAEAFVDRCIMQIVQGEDISVSGSQAKYGCTELLGRVVDECVQLHGGYGYMEEYPIARAYVDARIQRIFGGTSEVMKEIIARSVLS